MAKHFTHRRSPAPPHSAPKPHAPKPQAPASTHWGEVADWYDTLVGDEGSEYHQHVILPGLLRLLDLKSRPGEKPFTILDLACGQGVTARHLARAGCQVVGVDAAAPLIEAARRRNETDRLPIHYVIADAAKLLGADGALLPNLIPSGNVAGDGFDAVTIILAIQNMTPLSPIWQACRAALNSAGRLIVVMMHPAFRIPRQSDWIWQNAASGGMGTGEAQGRVVYQYLTSSKIEIQTHPGKAAHGKDSSTTAHFHRPLQAYINTLGNAGLAIDHIEEWISHKSSQPGPKKSVLDRARKEIPLFLALRARRCP
jgi:SAM-dependent methyltransferase